MESAPPPAGRAVGDDGNGQNLEAAGDNIVILISKSVKTLRFIATGVDKVASNVRRCSKSSPSDLLLIGASRRVSSCKPPASLLQKGGSKVSLPQCRSEILFCVSAGTAPRIKFPDQSHLNGRLSAGAPRFRRRTLSDGVRDQEAVCG